MPVQSYNPLLGARLELIDEKARAAEQHVGDAPYLLPGEADIAGRREELVLTLVEFLPGANRMGKTWPTPSRENAIQLLIEAGF